MGFADVLKVVGTIASMAPTDSGTPPRNDGEIYRIWFNNDPSSKCYIGQTTQGALARVNQHINDAKTPTGGCALFSTKRLAILACRLCNMKFLNAV